MTEQFSWVPFYREAANRLLEWEHRQDELIEFLEQLRKQGLVITPLLDQDSEGARFPLKEIDPFTFFGVFNRGIRDENRLAILAAVRTHLNIKEPLPTDFHGVPVLNNQRSWFFGYQQDRQPDDVERLWTVFDKALGPAPLEDPEFGKAFDAALDVNGTNLNLTMGLFWIRPETFLNLDARNREFLKIRLPAQGLSATFYGGVVSKTSELGKSFPQLSYEAVGIQPDTGHHEAPDPDRNYWFVGASWSDQDPPDLTNRFLAEGIWQHGFDAKYLDEVRSMGVGERIAIKATFTQRWKLPFDSNGKTVSCMRIKAIGTIVANRGDGRTVEVEWDPAFEPKDWYFYTYLPTVWRVRPDDEYAKRLIDFAFNDVPQDYAWFAQQLLTPKGEGVPPIIKAQAEPYSLADVIAAGVFAPEAELTQALERLGSKKNLIIQGPPGVGKTFVARKLAYAFIEARDDKRVQMVQFHQSYSYDDFVRGYRPDPEHQGTFALQDGIFLKFCATAREDIERKYIFIIDEINRGNLSQIFGELLMLIEGDKREAEYAVPLVYRRADQESEFYIPSNVYIIGLMNVADRSLAMVDYALRRRFAFMTLRPEYGSSAFKEWLLERNMAPDLVQLIAQRMIALNKGIADDPLLGENYQVGHSFFCPKGTDFADLDRAWYDGVIKTEILPLLREYWFDSPKSADDWEKVLVG